MPVLGDIPVSVFLLKLCSGCGDVVGSSGLSGVVFVFFFVSKKSLFGPVDLVFFWKCLWDSTCF